MIHPTLYLFMICARSGLSAWQNWTYSVKCSLNGLVISEISYIAATHTTVLDLQSSQHYVLSVWAVSPGGSSYTVMFQGTTLQPGKIIVF